MYTMAMLLDRCEQQLAEAIENQDELRISRLTEVADLLTGTDFFKTHDFVSCMYLLFRLKFLHAEALDVLQDMNPIRVYVGRLSYQRDGRVCRTHEMYLAPSIETYGAFARGGFFKETNDSDFYSLYADGRWHYDPELQRRWDLDTIPVSVELLREVTGKVNPRKPKELHGPVTL